MYIVGWGKTKSTLENFLFWENELSFAKKNSTGKVKPNCLPVPINIIIY